MPSSGVQLNTYHDSGTMFPATIKIEVIDSTSSSCHRNNTETISPSDQYLVKDSTGHSESYTESSRDSDLTSCQQDSVHLPLRDTVTSDGIVNLNNGLGFQIKTEPVDDEGDPNWIVNDNISKNLYQEQQKTLLEGTVLQDVSSDEQCLNDGNNSGELPVLLTDYLGENGHGPHNLKHVHQCSVCGQKFLGVTVLSEHMRVHGETVTRVKMPKPLTCEICRKSFKCTAYLNRHIKVHSCKVDSVDKHEKCHECDLCGKQFGTSRGVKRHIANIHTRDNKVHTCNMCGKSFVDKSSLQRHSITHSKEKPYICSSCGRGFKSRSGRSSHMERCGDLAGGPIMPITQSIENVAIPVALFKAVHSQKSTGLIFNERETVKVNILEDDVTMSSPGTSTPSSTKITEEGNVHVELIENRVNLQNSSRFVHENRNHVEPLIMNEAKRLKPVRSRLKKASPFSIVLRTNMAEELEVEMEDRQSGLLDSVQVKIENGSETETPNKCLAEMASEQRQSRLRDKVHVNIENERETTTLYKCVACKTQFDSKDELHCHIQTHSWEKPFVCTLCGQNLGTKATLLRHMKTHTKKKPYRCGTCEKGYVIQAEYVAHMRIHTGERPFMCRECGKGFMTKSVHRDHLKIHTNERSFICTECGKAFATKRAMKRHLACHSTDRPHKCDRCSRTYKTIYILKRHIRFHDGWRPFICKTCSRTFSHQTDYKRHLRTHTGERPFKCAVCKKGFKQNHHLSDHMNTHSRQVVFLCDFCPQRCATRSSLRKHVKRHNPGGNLHSGDETQSTCY